ncbi:MAG: tRNA uridine-5-carboxymethylaminomethyl(34) synthesis GTPase MnmE [Acidiphilium sp. 37-64-53]|uniref:tRNA uridine-5-carboxymethylaminomethyl(34) synthesis GTPase MnmE n=1 Tax=Acidiphilium TaxID=522 RepID=UPI000BC77076|nr:MULTISPECIES: tRNA uridine-5-carboxymethylaminomethyl(34) synthesis GTPase MnmE [Acidiphilium]OYW02792.1 MAG: tRNA uridine-5-carboxymethylaminomethyl(34) synthesis GTPase MnmE [Acidiphilium sp. 37-64-53]OZB29207.1 MAG: tRNA uridine-5-carboxymethylaminomethyl(34) synthesis GTPase MnmE [Acidiphilium sp. 34-64-41]HQT84764.1 tRNA uridine-5-carboxymethylaminomethyl(34) synthesis GTPase MnmE [Acidiphilium rubrum]
MTDVIFATASGVGGAIAVVRLSGAGIDPIVRALSGTLPAPRRASVRRFHDGEGRLIDQGLLIRFPGPASVTGEDYAELHTHGGRAVAAALTATLIALGARPAEPGEFSRRAFGNGKLDLLQAEGVADLIGAETEAQRVLALDQAGGAMSEAIGAWRGRLVGLMARQAALIDFADEDLPPDVEAAMLADIDALHLDVMAAIGAGVAAERLREGVDIVVLGAPNAGKSTLVNVLAGEDVAIVSDTPGTTRDAIGVRLDLGGVPVRLVDTAGLREAADAIEAEGIHRAEAHARRADFLILCAAAPDFVVPAAPAGVPALIVATKADLAGACPDGALAVSAQTGAGVAALVAALTEHVAALVARGAGPALPRPRQIACLRDMAAALERAMAVAEPELRAADLQAAADALARLVGVIGVEDVLDQVFSSFCIGK